MRVSGEEEIMKLAIELSEAQRERLTLIAGRLNVPIEALAEAAIRELISKSEAEFVSVAARLLVKNQELYERLG